MIAREGINLPMIDVVTTYLYDSLDSDIYIKLFKGFNFLETHSSSCQEDYTIKLNKSRYGLKHSRHMWYNRLIQYLLREGYKNDSICLCIFI